MPSKPVLISVDGRGRSEIIRMILTAGGLDFEERNIETREELDDIRKDLLFEHIPALKIDGKQLVQPGAIVRHLARRFELLGSNDDDTTMIDMLFEGTRDFIGKFYAFGYANDAKLKEEIDAKVLTKFLPIYNKILEQSKTGFLVGSSLTICDIGLLEVILSIIDYFGTDQFDKLPGIKKFYKMMKSQANISKYIDKIRKPVNNEEYVKKVKELFG